jgi:MtrB/PioB family decaheme-associated outer membrane protein
MRYQDQPLLPFTINTALNTEPIGAVPSDLAGDVRTTMINASITNRALRNVSVTARYRYFDYADETPDLHLGGRVSMDRSVSTTALERERFPFTRQNGSVDLSWRPALPTQFQVGYGWEQWTRDEHVRNVAESDEHSWRGTISVAPADWFSLRSSVVQSRRRADDYRQVTTAQNPLQRRFDQADRDRTRIELRAEWSALEAFTLGSTISSGTDKYPDSRIGLQSDKARAYGADAAWTPTANVSLSAGYMLETFKNRLRSQYRTPTQLANPTYDWVANNDDEITTWYVGGETSINRFDVGFNLQRSDAWLDMNAFNPVPPAGGTASENTGATAVDFPRIKQEFMPVTAFLRFTPRPQWTLGLGFTYEEYENADWRTDDLSPVDGVHVLLGNDLLDYKAGYMSFTITYRPQLRRAAAI